MTNDDKDYGAEYYAGKDFARRSTPRLPNRRETEEIAQAFAEQFDYDFEEAWAIILRSYIAVFEAYRSENGMVCKIASVHYETGIKCFDHYAWEVNGCAVVERKK